MDPLEVHDVGDMDPKSAEAFLDAVAEDIKRRSETDKRGEADD